MSLSFFRFNERLAYVTLTLCWLMSYFLFHTHAVLINHYQLHWFDFLEKKKKGAVLLCKHFLGCLDTWGDKRTNERSFPTLPVYPAQTKDESVFVLVSIFSSEEVPNHNCSLFTKVSRNQVLFFFQSWWFFLKGNVRKKECS